MGHLPFFLQEVGINSEGGERIGPDESKFAVHPAQHSEDTAVLHVAEFLPELLLGKDVRQKELRLKVFRGRKQGKTHFARAERMHGQSIQAQLDAAAINELLAKFFFGRRPVL